MSNMFNMVYILRIFGQRHMSDLDTSILNVATKIGLEVALKLISHLLISTEFGISIKLILALLNVPLMESIRI